MCSIVMTVRQLSLFSAEAHSLRVSDLAGLLCGPGQMVRFGASATARLSIVLADESRAQALAAECETREVAAELLVTPTGGTVLRTAFRADLVPLADSWARGAMKALPPGFELDGVTLRIWMLGAGSCDGAQQLALDPQAPGTYAGLLAAATKAGLPATVVHQRGSRPVLRVANTQRVRSRLAELVGPPPVGVDPAGWPAVARRA